MVDEDHSELSKTIVADLSGDAALDTVTLPRVEARLRVGSGKLRAALVLPLGFGDAAPRALFGGADKPPIELLYDPSQPMVRPILEGLLTQHVMQQVTRALFSAGGSTAVVQDSLAQLRASTALPSGTRDDLVKVLEAVQNFQSHGGAAPAGVAAGAGAGGGLSVPFTLTTVAVSSGPSYNSYAHSFAGMSVQFILFMGIDAGVALLLLRQQGMWQRLRAAPLSRSTLLGSRIVGTALIALSILVVVYLAAFLLFNVRIAGSVPGFVCVAVAFAMLAACTGLMIAAVGGSVGATRGLSIFVALILVMLGGAWVPAFLFPAWLQRVSQAVPTRWAVDGFDAMTWRGLPFDAALLPVAVMLGWAAVFALVAVWRFEWQER